MDFIDWLLYSITVSRRLTNSYYIIMLIITVIALFLMYKMRFKRFSLYLWLISGLICLFWEIYLFSTGARHYNFIPALELPYHAITEAGPGLIIMILFGHMIRLIDISEYSDDYETPVPPEKSELKPKKKVKTRLEKPVKKPRPAIKEETDIEEFEDEE